MTRSEPRLAVVDRDRGFVRVLVKRAEALRWHVRIFDEHPDGRDLGRMHLAAVVIDPAVAGPDAWSYLSEVAERLPRLALVVCASQATVAERVRGLRLGADDWITKPCHPEEVLARVEAALRARSRGVGFSAKPRLAAGELEIRRDMYEAYVRERAVGLTRREFELLDLLASAAGAVVPRERIYEQVWGYAMVHGDRSVDVFVRKLRQKLRVASPGWRYLHTHFGVGYRFDAEAEGVEPVDAPERSAPFVKSS
jgi:DNA-binding response OmpR family regulator